MQLAWPDQALHNGNVYGVLPASAAKNISIYLMLVHQVRLWVMHRGSAAPTAVQDWCSLGIGMQLVSQMHPFMCLGRSSQSVLHHTQRSNYLLCIANNLEPDTVRCHHLPLMECNAGLLRMPQIIAFCLYSAPLFYMCERALGVHKSSLPLRVLARLPVCECQAAQRQSA